MTSGEMEELFRNQADMKTMIKLFQAELGHVKEGTSRIEEKVDELYKILKGDNGEGLVTKVALARASIKRVWGWLSIISTFLVMLTLTILKKIF